MNARGKNTNTNYVDSDTESEQNSTPKYTKSVGEKLGQRSGIVTAVSFALIFFALIGHIRNNVSNLTGVKTTKKKIIWFYQLS